MLSLPSRRPYRFLLTSLLLTSILASLTLAQSPTEFRSARRSSNQQPGSQQIGDQQTAVESPTNQPALYRPASTSPAIGQSNPSSQNRTPPSESFASNESAASQPQADPWIAKGNYPHLPTSNNEGTRSFTGSGSTSNTNAQFATHAVANSGEGSVQMASFTSDPNPARIPLKTSKAGSEIERTKKSSSTISSMISMMISLALVIAIFMGLAWLLRSAQPAVTKGLPKDVVEVLGRTTLAPRQQMYVIKFGRKLILVSQQMGQTATLTEIEDPQEVDHLLGLIESGSPTSISNSFKNVFHQIAVGKTNLTSWISIGLFSLGLATFSSSSALAQNNESGFRTPTAESNRGLGSLLKSASDTAFGDPALSENSRDRANEIARKNIDAINNASMDPTDEDAKQDGANNLLAGPAKWVSPEGLSGSLQIMLLLTVLSLAPAILLMTTCYIRIIVVLGLLRQALGAAQLPPSQVITSISLFVTLFVMAPVWNRVYEDSIKPYTDGKSGMTMEQAWEKGVKPVRQFMSRQIAMAGNHDDVLLFHSRYAPKDPPPEYFDDVPLTVLLPAYMLSELKTAFMMGFQIYLPFLILDIVIASVTISMGMMMLPPAMISMPFKLLLFVLVDGWRLVVQMLLDSFGTFG